MSYLRPFLWLLPAVFIALSGELAYAAESDMHVGQFQRTTWTAKDGAPSDVWALAQTSDGWIWLGGPNGLYRFDGVRFERFELDAGDRNRSNAVSSLFALPSGELLIGRLNGGVSILRNAKFTQYDNDDTRRAGTVLSFAQDRQGALWAPAQHGLLRFERDAWHLVGDEWHYPGGYASAAMTDANGSLWVTTRKEILRLTLGSRGFESVRIDPSSAAELIQSPDGKTWYFDDGGVHLLPDQASSSTRESSVNSRTSYRALFDRDGYFWYWWSPSGSRQAHPLVTDVASLGAVKTIFEDREGNIWLGSTGDALHRLRRPDVSRLASSPSVDGSTPWIAFAADKIGRVWMGLSLSGNGGDSVDGVWKVDARVEHMQVGEITSATAISAAPGGSVWVAGLQGLWRLEGARFVNGPALPSAVLGNAVRGVSAECSGALWVSIQGAGLLRHDSAGWMRNGNIAALPADIPTVQSCDSTGRLWLGYGDGTVRVLTGNRVDTFTAAHGLQVGAVSALSIGRSILVGGERGLAVLRGAHFATLSPSIPGVFTGLTGIAESSNGDIWVNGTRGAIYIESAMIDGRASTPAQDIAVTLFDSGDGYPAPSYSIAGMSPTIIRGSDERIWLAGHGGIASIDPARIRHAAQSPPIVIESLVAGDTRYEPSLGLELTEGTRNLRVEYTALSYAHPERLRFRYRLEGVDDTWVEAGPRRQAFYSNLGPGEYRFVVDSTNDRGIWSGSPATLSFAIPPTFVQSRGFLAICVIVATGLVVVLYRTRARQLAAREVRRLEERLGERERIARELHDTLLQSIQGLILKFHALTRDLPLDAPQRAKVEQALKSAEDVIAEGRDRIQDLRGSDLIGTDLGRTLAQVGDDLVRDSDVEFRLVSEGDVREIASSVIEASYWIAREALVNAARHAEARKIECRILYGSDAFRIGVRDDGTGIDSTELDTKSAPVHWGIKGMYERALHIGAHLAIQGRPGAGTGVELTVPAAIAYRGHDTRSPWRKLLRRIAKFSGEDVSAR